MSVQVEIDALKTSMKIGFWKGPVSKFVKREGFAYVAGFDEMMAKCIILEKQVAEAKKEIKEMDVEELRSAMKIAYWKGPAAKFVKKEGATYPAGFDEMMARCILLEEQSTKKPAIPKPVNEINSVEEVRALMKIPFYKGPAAKFVKTPGSSYTEGFDELLARCIVLEAEVAKANSKSEAAPKEKVIVKTNTSPKEKQARKPKDAAFVKTKAAPTARQARNPVVRGANQVDVRAEAVSGNALTAVLGDGAGETWW